MKDNKTCVQLQFFHCKIIKKLLKAIWQLPGLFPASEMDLKKAKKAKIGLAS